MQQGVDTWEGGLIVSGGALKPFKCKAQMVGFDLSMVAEPTQLHAHHQFLKSREKIQRKHNCICASH